MSGSYSAAERGDLARAVQAGEIPVCPTCDVRVHAREVEPSRQVSYVRRRVWLLCPSCKRTASVDATGR